MARDLIEGEFDFKFVSVPIRGLFNLPPLSLKPQVFTDRKRQKMAEIAEPIQKAL